MKKVLMAGIAALLFANCSSEDNNSLSSEQSIVGKWFYTATLNDAGERIPVDECASKAFVKFSKNLKKGAEYTTYGLDKNGECVIESYYSDYTFDGNVLKYGQPSSQQIDTLTFLDQNTLKFKNQYTNGVIFKRE